MFLPVLGTVPALRSVHPAIASFHLGMFQESVQLLAAFPFPSVYLLRESPAQSAISSMALGVQLCGSTTWSCWTSECSRVGNPGWGLQFAAALFQCSLPKTYRIVTNNPSLLIDGEAAGVWLLVIAQGLLTNVAVELAALQLSGPQDQKTFHFFSFKYKNWSLRLQNSG